MSNKADSQDVRIATVGQVELRSQMDVEAL